MLFKYDVRDATELYLKIRKKRDQKYDHKKNKRKKNC